MKKTVIKSVIICLMNTFYLGECIAQNPAWSLTPRYYKNIISSLPTVSSIYDGYTGTPAKYNSNMQLDAQGNILFFVVDNRVFNKNGQAIDELYSAASSPVTLYMQGNAEMLIVPDPGNCQRYYIIASADDNSAALNNEIPHYALVDMSQTNQFGFQGNLVDVSNDGYTMKSLASITSDYFTGDPYQDQKMGGVSLAVSKLRADNSYLLFLTNGKKVYRYKIDNTGISYLSSFPLSTISNAFDNLQIRSEMELVSLSNGNYRIAVPYLYEPVSSARSVSIFTADLDANGVLISSSTKQLDFNFSTSDTYHPFVHGLEFSPDGNVLYITHDNSFLHPNPIEYYTFSNPTAGVQPLNVTNALDFKNSQLEIGIDNKLYFATSNRLATLSNPNSPSTSNWTNNALAISYSANYASGTSSEYYLKTYTLPDQIDGMDYEAHFYANTQCCIANSWYSKEAFTATASATWQPGSNPFGNTTSDVYIKDVLVIPANINITIKNMTFMFAPDAKVIVERAPSGAGNLLKAGGKLTLDNSRFSADVRCNENGMWLGIQVYGYKTNSQTASGLIPVKQGTLVMINNATIEHSRFGVDLAKLNASTFLGQTIYMPDLNYTGGIIQATNSRFRNNVNDVRFWDYAPSGSTDNVSYFMNSTFITDNVLNNSSLNPQNHVYLQNVRGVKFLGNDFKNTLPSAYNYDKRGFGIYSVNSKIYIDARCTDAFYPCNNFDPNVFQDLYYGIYATSTDITRTIRSDRNKYINNIYGMFLNGQNFSKVIRNDFDVFRSKAPNPTLETVGLYLQNSTGYQVEENTFQEYNDPNVSGVGNSVGVVVNNSGEVDNAIYRNTFTNLNVGGQSQNINAPVLPSSGWNSSLHGLKWKCNTFTGNMQTADLAVTSGRIDYQQGYLFSPVSDPVQATKAPAGNKFSHSNNNSENDIKVNSSAQQFQYIHHSDYITKPVSYTTSKVSPYMNYNIFYPVAFNGNSCPSNFGTEGIVERPLLTAQLDSLKTLISEKEELVAQANLNNEKQVKTKEVNGEVPLSKRLDDEISYLKSVRTQKLYETMRAIIADTTLDNAEEIIQTITLSENLQFPSAKLPDAKLSEGQFLEVSVLDYFLAPTTSYFETPIIEKVEPTSVSLTQENDQNETISYLSIYPNPSTAVTNTSIALQNILPIGGGIYKVEIYDLSVYGKLWFSEVFNTDLQPISIPNNLLLKGFYAVKLLENDILKETRILRVD